MYELSDQAICGASGYGLAAIANECNLLENQVLWEFFSWIA